MRLERIRQLIQVLQQHPQVSTETLDADLFFRLGIERGLTQLADAGVDINSHLLVAGGAPMPDAARSTFVAVAELGIIPVDLATQIAPSVGIR